MSSSLIAFSLIASVAGGWCWRRAAATPAQRVPAAAARQRISDPRRQGAAISRLWQLHSNGCQCATAKALAGRRLDIDDTVAVAQPGAGSQQCRCYYRPLADVRRRARRAGDERRSALRFELHGGERRGAGERRHLRDAWGAGRVR